MTSEPYYDVKNVSNHPESNDIEAELVDSPFFEESNYYEKRSKRLKRFF